MENFVFKKIDFNDSAMMEQLYRLRFEVYCRECNFIREADYPRQREQDEHDAQSVHFAAFNSYGEVVGTLRMILPGALPLPIKTHCPDIHFEGTSYAEISRLVISRRLRRRAQDQLYYEPQVEDIKVASNSGEFLRRARPMAFGLYREMYRESKRLGTERWYTLMEKGLWLLLAIHGFKFESIGDEVDFYGLVRPYLGKVSVIEQDVQKKFPQFFEYFVEKS